MTDTATSQVGAELAKVVLADVETLAGISDGEPGVTRLAYSERDNEARGWFCERAAALGFRCVIDAVGNSFAFNPAADDRRPILLGSHLDSVRHGGRYDGTLGVLIALAAAGHLTRTAPRLPLGVVSFACEESTRFGFGAIGSRYAVGELQESHLGTIVDGDGKSLGEALDAAGFGWSPTPSFRIDARTVDAYLEPHIDQGTLLNNAGSPLGIVTSIAGVDRVAIDWIGEAAHSGARIRADRRDALLAAADFVTRVYELWCELDPDGDRMAATVGRIVARPNSPNTVAGEVEMIADVRSATPELLETAVARVKQLASRVATVRQVEANVRELGRLQPVPMATAVIDALLGAATENGPRRERVVSLSGHDAMVVGTRVRSGMVLLPNPSGISHAPEESVREESIAETLHLLVGAIPLLAAGDD